MSSATLYRICAGIFVLFAIGHTVGFLTLIPPTQESLAVWNGMNQVRFSMHGQSFSYGEFYRGFGLSATVSMLFEAFLCWHLARMARLYPKAIGGVGWALCAVQVTGVVFSLLYFASIPALFSAVLTLLLAWAAWQSRRSAVLA